MLDNSHSKKIVVSDHFNIENVEALFDVHVHPFINDISKSDQLSPRRILGNYLTYLVVDNSATFSVMIKKDKTEISAQCTCPPFQKNDTCKHIAIVLLSMQKQIIEEISEKQTNLQKLELKKKRNLEEKLNKALLIEQLQAKMNETLNSKKKKIQIEVVDPALKKEPFIIKNAKDFSFYRLTALIPSLRNVNRRGKEFKRIPMPNVGVNVIYKFKQSSETIYFKVNDDDDIEVKCSCGETYKNDVCSHATDSIFYLIDTGSFSQFIPFTNQNNEKNRLLADFGLTVHDEEANEFTFSTDYSGRLNLNHIPPQYVSVNRISGLSNLLKDKKTIKKISKYKEEAYKIGIFFQLSNKNFINNPLKIEAYKIETGKKGEEKISRILIGKEENTPILSVMDDNQFDVLMDFSFLTFKEMVGSGYYTQSYSIFTSQYYDSTRKQYLKYFLGKLDEHWKSLCTWENVRFLPEGENFAKSNLKNLTLVSDPVYPEIGVTTTEKFISIKLSFTDADGQLVIHEGDDMEIFMGKIIHHNDHLYLNKRDDLVNFLSTMPNGVLNFPSKFAEKVMKEILYPLHQQYGVIIPESLSIKVKEVAMVPAIHLKEFQDKYLMIAPKFHYEDKMVDMLDKADQFFVEEDGEKLLLRNTDEEEAFVDYIRSMHTQFKIQNFQPYFLLPFEDVMKNQWFITFSKELMSQNIKMVGFHDLKRFKYNNATPKWDMKVSSGIDWFDIKVTATWGDQEMSFKDIRKAITNGQSFVVLGDGSFGMLPEEWIQKYSNLFRFGIEDKDGLKVSKKQFNIVEMLFDQIDDEDVLAEIEEKKQKLLHVENVKTLPIPSTIKATLRPYQETGYQWMQVLDEISWGGCLADDMGLGKTLQAITFLSYLKQKYDNPTSLIICPTSLIYNWESELNKFAPNLKYHIFYGLGRSFSQDHFDDYDVIISSYGIVRNDIETLVKFDWEYVILDESQAIKNPDAISTKAVQLLKARNKFILSGTPLQNNTYDIYAQFNFLNPGMLGGREFFKQEFANPIDKNGDKDAGMMLRRLIKPFMLRRTKSEVATDLPEKTETILWCQMEKSQKALYDEYKDFYRHSLMQKIETDGVAKAGVYILEGLLRLRQICDDPRLIKDKDIKPFKGVKIKELVREIQENMGDHKMLVFSQFTEMLALIREEMDESKIKYCYLDGGTPALQRKEQVEIFQNQGNINVFLISLKAGGVGLNLTEADYVYIVDPWWNPAVEQQAIDRTHRIGQKNKIFAYKMICKDTVEEKIIQLQEKKMSISKEIVQEDTAFFKSLSKEDIGFLFS
jgi:non-specific serine/threonine protein kinase